MASLEQEGLDSCSLRELGCAILVGLDGRDCVAYADLLDRLGPEGRPEP